MNPGHDECDHEAIEEKTLSAAEPTVVVQCLHEHREPVWASDGILQHAVGFHCHCCGRVWNDHAYIKGRPHA